MYPFPNSGRVVILEENIFPWNRIEPGQFFQIFMTDADENYYNIVLYNKLGNLYTIYPADLDSSAIQITSLQPSLFRLEMIGNNFTNQTNNEQIYETKNRK